MKYYFPTAQQVRIQMLKDRHSALYDSKAQLAKKTEIVMLELIGMRLRAGATAFDHLQYQYKANRLNTLLGLNKFNGVFTATVPYDVELLMELCYHGTWNCWVGHEKKYMEISTVPLYP